MFEFHVSRKSRERYGFDDSLFTTNGNVVVADFKAARRFARRINQIRNAALHPEQAVHASDINAMGLIDEVWHQVFATYRNRFGTAVMREAFEYAGKTLGEEQVNHALERFCHHFPPLEVYRGLKSEKQYLDGATAGVSNRLIAVEEMLLLNLANENPAFRPFAELFDDSELKKESRYREVIDNVEEYFRTQPLMDPGNLTLLDFMRLPFRLFPESLSAQLRFIRENWGHLLGGILADLLRRILLGLDFIEEEQRPRFFGKGPAPVLQFGPREMEEPEKFSADLDWMPQLVLMAKSTYVWLEQLSRKYEREVRHLDQIPEEELENMARWGFTGLWLIGIWERSQASRKIKQMTGNPEALASAYSIYDYEVAYDLGGEEAYQGLKAKAWKYGIRMATDMVPNHMGIYSRWVVEHPDWFIQLPYSPFPDYRFSGENLSDDERVELQIEDGYWNRSDAAVVFKRRDRLTGEERFIYHGNDGTSMPWNDTAQLNMLLPAVREAVIRTTIDVARRFPVIRFDAAMTLAKKHYQRLWFPLPGYGGDIPSRSENSISDEEFQRAFPVEFWRELVDRIALEAPDTLLLAEAFWLMEGYFVRTLGMHRVYNSAFMNMLKDEENSKYRDVIKNLLRFNPEILKRFVNFMNNPDEEPAVEQFGKGDKYFGVATLMVTMPGLPMFGHGQIEGFGEKYGMEYARAYWDEQVDDGLVERHVREIFPLMRKRHLFSDVKNFVFYDLVMDNGHVNEDVFAYSNICGSEKALIVYNNRYAEVSGTLKRSVGYSEEHGGSRHIVHKSLAEGLEIRGETDIFYVFRDLRSGLEFIRRGDRLAHEGLRVHLGAYQANVFLDFREIQDADGIFAALADDLGGRGVPDMFLAATELRLRPVIAPFAELVQISLKDFLPEKQLLADKALVALKAFVDFNGLELRAKTDALAEVLAENILSIRQMAEPEGAGISPEARTLLLATVLDGFVDLSSERECGLDLAEEMLLLKTAGQELMAAGLDAGAAGYRMSLIRIMLQYDSWKQPQDADWNAVLLEMLGDERVRSYLGVNFYEDIWWFNLESLQDLTGWLLSLAASRNETIEDLEKFIAEVLRMAEDSEYNLNLFMRELES